MFGAAISPVGTPHPPSIQLSHMGEARYLSSETRVKTFICMFKDLNACISEVYSLLMMSKVNLETIVTDAKIW